MRTRDKQTATENVSRWCFILYEKTQKNLRGVGGGGGATTSPRSPPPVRPRVNLNACKWALLSIIIFYWT